MRTTICQSKGANRGYYIEKIIQAIPITAVNSIFIRAIMPYDVRANHYRTIS